MTKIIFIFIFHFVKTMILCSLFNYINANAPMNNQV